MNKENNEKLLNNTMKIDLVDLLITIIERKRKVYRYMLVFLIIGLILLVITPKE